MRDAGKPPAVLTDKEQSIKGDSRRSLSAMTITSCASAATSRGIPCARLLWNARRIGDGRASRITGGSL